MTAPSPPSAAFAARHLHDYAPAARRLWLALALAGGLVLAWALWQLSLPGAPPAWRVAAGLMLVGAAAMFPVSIPRTTSTVVVADAFVLYMLVGLGLPAAVLAAAAEASIAAWRGSNRLAARVSSPAAAMLAMLIGGSAFEIAENALVAGGLAHEVAALAALCALAMLPTLITTALLLHLVAAKRGRRLDPGAWARTATAMAPAVLASGFVAGLVHLNAHRSGPVVLVVAAAVVMSMVGLLRLNFSRQEAERRRHEARLAEAEHEAALGQRRFTAAFTHAAVGMAIVAPGGCVLQANAALCRLLGRGEAALVGTEFGSLLRPADAELLRRQADAVVRSADDTFSIELRVPGPDDDDLWTVLHCSRFVDNGPGGLALIYQLHDITSRQRAEARLRHIAYHDSLTDLANRTYFHERLEAAVERSRLDPGERFAVLFLDLDRFKTVNDSLGHVAGNELLRAVARRLRRSVRPRDLVARLGGDEFAVLLEPLQEAEDGLVLAQQLLEGLRQPLQIGGTEVLPGASVGITFSDHGYRTVDEVLRDADLAMYEAKAGGRGRVAAFDRTMHERAADKLALENDLRHAIGEGRLALQYQPICALESRRVLGFEALARWTHPQRGPVSPAVFVALAEESGHITALTGWVIEQAVAHLADWQRGIPGGAALTMNVNISGHDLARDDLPEVVAEVLQRHGVAPQTLTLEITETTLMARLDVALTTMERLRRLGVRFSIDDFGTGYSSLAYLSTLPIDSLKIDRSFVSALLERPQNAEIVRAVLQLGQTLGRTVVAEGIETAEQLRLLRQLGVPRGQGYLLARPMRPEQVQDWMSAASVA